MVKGSGNLSSGTVAASCRAALAELAEVVAEMDDRAVRSACNLIAGSNRIALYGCGREALQIRGFAMRLFHLGLDVAMVGDINAPALEAGDLLICSSGPRGLATVDALMGIAAAAGARVLLLTAQPQADSVSLAKDTLVIPAQTMATDQGAQATSVLPMGSLYEGAMFVVLEILVLRLHADARAMRARHTNLE